MCVAVRVEFFLDPSSYSTFLAAGEGEDVRLTGEAIAGAALVASGLADRM